MLLDNMQLGDNIARNAALRENIFMMAICVELRIPLFLVGKPGSSKSLAKSIINESMRGKDSRNELLKNFKEVSIGIIQHSKLTLRLKLFYIRESNSSLYVGMTYMDSGHMLPID